MLKIKKPKSFNWKNIIVACLLGTLSGIYIYQPIIAKQHESIEKSNNQIKGW